MRPRSSLLLALAAAASLMATGCGSGVDVDTPAIPTDLQSGTNEQQILEVVDRYNAAVLQRDGTSMCEAVLAESARPGRDALDCAALVTSSIRRNSKRWPDIEDLGLIRVDGRTAVAEASLQGEDGEVELEFLQRGGRWYLVPFN